MAANEKHEPVTFGASVLRSPSPLTTPSQPLRSPPSNDSTMSSATATANAELAAKKEWAADPSNPYSAFYKHPEALRETRHSLNESAPQSKTHLGVGVHEHDLEGGVPLSVASTQQPSKHSVDGRVKECTMWPTRQAVLDKRKSYQRKRGCAFFRNLTNKQRMWAKIIIALLVIGAAVGLGVGISRAVGGGLLPQSNQPPPVSSTAHNHDFGIFRFGQHPFSISLFICYIVFPSRYCAYHSAAFSVCHGIEFFHVTRGVWRTHGGFSTGLHSIHALERRSMNGR
ncbi:hypothetical protein AG0111_0g10910 [Alternaria gaisen]|uniref:Uncharacterized protein n=1 Tax=Alternaria gaisen TaxID=167740 RepID=A0ACB6F993_9PLEO|nr:hypothetical protein AG0111_0g10910 [Alternaria gaisen]